MDTEPVLSAEEINKIKEKGLAEKKLHAKLNAKRASKFELVADAVLNMNKSPEQINEENRKNKLKARLQARSCSKLPTFAEAISNDAAEKITVWFKKCLATKRAAKA